MSKKKHLIDECPFCHVKPKVHGYTFYDSDNDERYWIGCQNDECVFQPKCGGFLTELEAVNAWNQTELLQLELIE